jgi:hypothetical protein
MMANATPPPRKIQFEEEHDVEKKNPPDEALHYRK